MPPLRQIPEDRKNLYYIGMALMVIGFISFFSVFVTGLIHFGDFSNFHDRVRSEGVRALLGIVLIGLGGFLRQTGRFGISGSGIKLDPEQARKDIEPWARMSGGVLKDTLDEAGIKLGGNTGGSDLPFDEKLRRLQALRQEGAITAEEFETTKKHILSEA